jgi:hypothetical protein
MSRAPTASRPDADFLENQGGIRENEQAALTASKRIGFEMMPNLRNPTVGIALGAGLLLSATSFAAADSGGASPGFSWKPKPKPPHAASAPAPAPIAIPMPMSAPTQPHKEPPPTAAPTPSAAPPAAAPPAQAPGPTAGEAPPAIQPPEPPPAPNGGAPLSTDQLTKLYQGLSSTARDTLENMIKTKGIDGLSKMNESDARSSFGGMPPNVREEIQAKWDGLSDEQRTALKKLKPDDLKQMAATQAKQMVQASVAPLMKPVTTVVDKTKETLRKSRGYVQSLIAKFSGGGNPDQSGE